MKKLLLLFSVVLFTTSGLLAQNASLAEKVKRKTDSFAKKLKLDNQQRDNIYAIYLDEAQRLEKIAPLKEEDSKKYRTIRKSTKQKTDVQIRKLLTKKQNKKYDKIKGIKKKKKKRK